MDVVTRGQPLEEGSFRSNIVKRAMTLLDSRFSSEVRLFRSGDDVRILADGASKDIYMLTTELMPQLQYLIEDTQVAYAAHVPFHQL